MAKVIRVAARVSVGLTAPVAMSAMVARMVARHQPRGDRREVALRLAPVLRFYQDQDSELPQVESQCQTSTRLVNSTNCVRFSVRVFIPVSVKSAQSARDPIFKTYRNSFVLVRKAAIL